ncbi:hypothetical protein QUF90_00660 [Desulfococcaceae bacterium HSG9]|nr:hypothetical protein [Desulfococcaceae bacterium HSG9]
MASNFRISFHRNKHNLQLKLRGDFDGSSCHELINTIKNKSRHFKIIIIDTGNLRTVYPFGQAIWEKNFSSLKNTHVRLAFTGAYQDRLSS